MSDWWSWYFTSVGAPTGLKNDAARKSTYCSRSISCQRSGTERMPNATKWPIRTPPAPFLGVELGGDGEGDDADADAGDLLEQVECTLVAALRREFPARAVEHRQSEGEQDAREKHHRARLDPHLPALAHVADRRRG